LLKHTSLTALCTDRKSTPYVVNGSMDKAYFLDLFEKIKGDVTRASL
jgi:hypothetical protein